MNHMNFLTKCEKTENIDWDGKSLKIKINDKAYSMQNFMFKANLTSGAGLAAFSGSIIGGFDPTTGTQRYDGGSVKRILKEGK